MTPEFLLAIAALCQAHPVSSGYNPMTEDRFDRIKNTQRVQFECQSSLITCLNKDISNVVECLDKQIERTKK